MVSKRLIALTLLLLASCDDPASTRPADADTSHNVEVSPDTASDTTPMLEPSVRYEIGKSSEDFFAFPYPSDARLNAAGAPDLSGFPTTRALLRDTLLGAIDMVETGSPGFSPLSAAYFDFEVPLDPNSLEDAVFLIDVTPSSPEFGEKRPAQVMYEPEGKGYWAADTVVIQPRFGQPLRSATTYAAVVTWDVRAADGSTLVQPQALRDLETRLSEGPTAPGTEVLRPLVEAMDDPSEILVATVFTTSSPFDELVALSRWMTETLPAPVAYDITLADSRARFDLYEGRVDAEEFFTGEPPYSDFGAGRITMDESGAPVARSPIALKFALSVPKGAMPAEGWPTIVYSHGLGEDYRGFVRVAAAEMADRGVAVLGIDPPLQGGRNLTGQDDRTLIVNLSVSNIVAGREIVRQGVLDELRMIQLVGSGGLVVPSDVSATGVELGLNPERIAFMGHSEGAQIGALLLPLAPELRGSVLSEGGGGAALTLLALELPEVNVAEAVAGFLGVDLSSERFEVDHPLISVVIQPLLDVADPLHSARYFHLEPRDNAAPQSWVMLEGFLDELTPPASMEALASAAGLPIAEPVTRPIEGLGSVALPAAENLQSLQGQTATGALLQLPDDDHYIIYFNDAVRMRLFDFLSSSLDGTPVLR